MLKNTSPFFSFPNFFFVMLRQKSLYEIRGLAHDTYFKEPPLWLFISILAITLFICPSACIASKKYWKNETQITSPVLWQKRESVTWLPLLLGVTWRYSTNAIWLRKTSGKTLRTNLSNEGRRPGHLLKGILAKSPCRKLNTRKGKNFNPSQLKMEILFQEIPCNYFQKGATYYPGKLFYSRTIKRGCYPCFLFPPGVLEVLPGFLLLFTFAVFTIICFL